MIKQVKIFPQHKYYDSGPLSASTYQFVLSPIFHGELLGRAIYSHVSALSYSLIHCLCLFVYTTNHVCIHMYVDVCAHTDTHTYKFLKMAIMSWELIHNSETAEWKVCNILSHPEKLCLYFYQQWTRVFNSPGTANSGTLSFLKA